MATAQQPRKLLTDQLAAQIRELVRSQDYGKDDYLPPERALGETYKVSRVTVRRALSVLVQEGLLEAVPYRGYRPVRIGAVAEGRQLGPVAYVLNQAGPDECWDETHAQILSAFNEVLLRRGGQALAVGARGRSAQEVVRATMETGAWGVALDSSREDLVDCFLKTGKPCVVVDAYPEHLGLDILLQNNLNGARRATEWLIEQGHRRIAWVGPTRGFVHYRERFAGARMGLWQQDVALAPENILDTGTHEAGAIAEVKVREALKRPKSKRPTAFICLWQPMAQAAARVIHSMGAMGENVELVAWATEKEYREVWAPMHLGGNVPATLVWRPSEMARVALSRLVARQKDPAEPAIRMDIPVRLLEPRKANDVVRGAMI